MPKRKFVNCPECDSPHARSMPAHGFRQNLLLLFGFYPFRCSDCYHRFLANPLGVANAGYAKCPRCLRMDLSTWDPKYYKQSAWMDLKAWFGAHRWRCDPCRTNFMSWRPRKQRYIRPADQQTPQPSVPPAADYHELYGG